MTMARWTHGIAPGMVLWEHQHVCISVARQTPNGSGRRCPLRVCLPPPGQASCLRPAPAPCVHCPTSCAHAYECLLIMCTVLLAFPLTYSALLSITFVHHYFSLSKCSSLVLSLPALPPEPAVYCLNPAAFVSASLFFIILVSLNQRPRSRLAKCHFSPLIHFHLMPAYFIHG